MENFIHSFQVSPEVCDGLIEYHKTNTEYKSKGIVGNRVRNYVKESTDVTFFKNSTDPIIQQYLSELHKAFIEYTTHFKIQTLALSLSSETTFSIIHQVEDTNNTTGSELTTVIIDS